MDNKRLITIAIDGFSSSGKSTMAKKLAKTIGYAYIDTGAMYRAVTLYCLRNGLFDGDRLDTERLEAALPDINITFGVDADGKTQTMLNGEVVEQEIRRMEVSSKVSIVAAVGSVRRALVKQQQAMGKQKGIVMDGRDIGTVVFPDAEMKVYVDASPETRARRRYEELRAKGDSVTYEDVLANVSERDRIDTTRAESPLRKADDAVVLDNSNMTIAEQDKWLLDLYNKLSSAE
ncbi:MAG: (d)CMP kinase [Oscillospiraceae bacterium]|nr:MAG: (d)CMP kinase [Oscillospiraceae bacterium]